MAENRLEKLSKIEMTFNYKKFKFIKGNRFIETPKVTKLIKSYNSGLNLFPYCPILINEAGYVIDGQHRYTACVKLKIPVYFMVVPNISLQQIAEINAASNRWSAKNFFHCYIESGNKDYEMLKSFIEKYRINISVAIGLLMNGQAGSGGGRGMEAFKQGQFKINYLEQATKTIKAAFDYKDVADEDVYKHNLFIRAIHLLLKSPSYKHKDIVERLKNKNCKIDRKISYKDYIYRIEELYNKGNSKRYYIYDGLKK